MVRGVTVVALSLSLAAFPGGAAEAVPRYEVSVWYPGWGTAGVSDYGSVSKNISRIGSISPYWYALKPDGSVDTYEWAEEERLLSLAHERGKPVMPLVTNEFDPMRVSRMLATASSREAHARDLTNLVVSKDYAGLDVDYESLRAANRERFSLFIENLALRLHARGKKLSVAVHAKTGGPGTWNGQKAQDWARLGRAVDEFRIMTYDYHWDGSKAGPAAPPAWIDAVLTFAEGRVAPQKIRMGLPFYGRDWVGTDARDLVHAEARALAGRHSATVRRHPSGEVYFTYAGGHTVFFQDPTSLSAKLDVILRKHPRVGGVAIWHVGGEPQSYWETINQKLGA